MLVTSYKLKGRGRLRKPCLSPCSSLHSLASSLDLWGGRAVSQGPRIPRLSPLIHPPSADPAGHVIDLVNDQLPDISISEEDKKKNLALLEEAKLVSERFLARRGRKSRSSPGESPSGRMHSGRATLSPSEKEWGWGRPGPRCTGNPAFKEWPLAHLPSVLHRPGGLRLTERILRGKDVLPHFRSAKILTQF